MGTAPYYRREAQRCREIAVKSTFAVKARWLELASEYDQLAEALEVQAPRAGAFQTQPMQQQQQQKKDTDPE
jgi:hypothetical protein